MRDFEHLRSLGIDVTPLRSDELVATLERSWAERTPLLVGAHNLHSAFLHQTAPDFRSFYGKADVVLIDGWPILALANRQRRRRHQPSLNSSYRVGSTDWIPEVLLSPGLTRLSVVGASQESNGDFVRFARRIRPDIEVVAIPGDPWNDRMMSELLGSLQDCNNQLTLIGAGMPLQERIALRLVEAGKSGVIATVGGAIDQLSGAQTLAPRWLGQLRIEWLWRLIRHPRKLSHRYLIEPIKLGLLLVRQRRKERVS